MQSLLPYRAAPGVFAFGLFALAALLSIVIAWSAKAQERISQWDVNLTQIETALGSDQLAGQAAEELRGRLDQLKADVAAQLTEIQTDIEPFQTRLDGLALPTDGSAPNPDLAAQRARLEAEIASRAAALGEIQALDVRIEQAQDTLTERRREIFTQQILSRGPSLFQTGVWLRGLQAIERKAGQIRKETASRLEKVELFSRATLVSAVAMIGLAGLLVLIFRFKAWAENQILMRVTDGDATRHKASCAVSLTLIRLLLPAAALFLAMGGLFSLELTGPQGTSLLRGLAIGCLLVIGAYGLTGAFFAPTLPQIRLSRFGDTECRVAQRRIVILAVIVALDNILVEGGEGGLSLPVEALVLINTALLAIGGISLWITATVLRPARETASGEDEEQEAIPLLPVVLNLLRGAVRIAAVAAPVLAMLGYYFASRYVFYPLVFSGAILGIAVLLFFIVRDAVREVLPEDESAPRTNRFQLIPVFVGFLLVCVALPVLALIWGASLADVALWWQNIKEGLVVGDVRLSPIDALTFLLVFAIGYVLTRMVQGTLSRNVLPLTGLDSGGRDAVTAGVGYLGVIIAALIAISSAGLDLSNIAIVAGALSVGIGFGLQNIVNNFVSGVILLIERPIKAGDWVELSSGMGYVKRVNVRSTEVQTFDRSTLFVPNSELISSPVINWTHSDMHGRIIVKVGVAYGTEPRKVEKILQEIADGHTMMLKRPAPYVLFRGFGSDSLDFEIRGVLRDVNWILNVQSDINYEIARRFDEAGIEIPFAQRDVTIKNLSEMGEGIARIVSPTVPSPAPQPEKAPHQPPAGTDGDGDGAGDGR
ncbi:MAG: DUF3772 domain-containing protein [Pseudomonadota bacterium]